MVDHAIKEVIVNVLTVLAFLLLQINSKGHLALLMSATGKVLVLWMLISDLNRFLT